MGKDQSLKKDSSLGPYRIVRLLGKGGMGEVYEAHDDALNRRVALKIILPDLVGMETIVKRFMVEGKALARMNHQNVVTVHTLGEERGIHYIVMEYIVGKSLDKVLKGSDLTYQDAIHYFKQMLKGVIVLHQNEIIHRDLKPSNIIVREDNSIKIVDFGIVKMNNQLDLDFATAPGVLVGSVYYLSPEIVRGGTAAVPTDIWSLGVILYEMLFGCKPFDGKNQPETLNKIEGARLEFPRDRPPEVSDAMLRIISKMCQKSMVDRYTKVEDVLADIYAAEKNQPILGKPKALKSRRFGRKLFRRTTAALLTILVLSGGSYWASKQKFNFDFKFDFKKELKTPEPVVVAKPAAPVPVPEPVVAETAPVATPPAAVPVATPAPQAPVQESRPTRRNSKNHKIVAAPKSVKGKKQLVAQKKTKLPSAVPKISWPPKPVAAAPVAAAPVPAPAPVHTPPPPARTVASAPALTAPEIKSPPNGTSIVVMGQTQDPIVFNWEKVKLAESYLLEFAFDKGFNEVFLQQRTKDTQLVLTEALPKGRIYWRVLAIKGSSRSPASTTFHIEIPK